jgi:hypothetical protein
MSAITEMALAQYLKHPSPNAKDRARKAAIAMHSKKKGHAD